MSRGPFHYGAGRGFVTTASGHRLSRREAMHVLARETAVSKDMNADPRTVRTAHQRVEQLTAAMTKSFPDQPEGHAHD